MASIPGIVAAAEAFAKPWPLGIAESDCKLEQFCQQGRLAENRSAREPRDFTGRFLAGALGAQSTARSGNGYLEMEDQGRESS